METKTSTQTTAHASAGRDYDEARIAQPFSGLSEQEMNNCINIFMEETQTEDWKLELFRRAAFLAEDPHCYLGQDKSLCPVNATEKQALDLEKEAEVIKGFWGWLKHFRAYPSTVYRLIACCSLGAIVQGMDETAVNGAQVFYQKVFNIKYHSGALGLVNSAPYLLAAIACL
ncbi:MAG: Solute carrier 2 (Facilitated glucose transporter) member 8 [Bathelium mastoideum]|nr:MAG: Solute carrier 2 (Facilitated glucose transporter) member 8 [Bathelium mastoideum]